VDDGWFEQPHLARVSLIRLWGWVRLHTCCALSYQCAPVIPIITTHSQGELMPGSMNNHLHGVSLSFNSAIKRFKHHHVSWVLKSPVKASWSMAGT
jgi:hypothetical protein